MSLNTITHDAVREALRALRYANSLHLSPLLCLSLVSYRLRSDRLADTQHVRSWVLGRCIEDAVDGQLRHMRGMTIKPPAAQLTAEQELAQLQRDLRSGTDDCLDWALVHWRYFSPTRQLVRDVARALGMTERTVQNRVIRGVMALTDRLRQLEIEASRELQAAPGAPDLDGTATGTMPAPPERAARHLSAELTAYRQGRIAEWTQPRYRLDCRFVELSLLVDVGQESQSGRWQAKEEQFTDLRDVLAAVSEPAVALLGPPGSGKSTLLRRLELDLARDAIGAGESGASAPFTFLVSLNQFRPPAPGAPLPAPREWLTARWAARYPQLPPLADVAARRPMVYLLDGLNELPHHSPEAYRARVALWKQFLLETVTSVSGHRAVISCRSLDYSALLSTPALRVPQVQVEPLTDEKVEAFLRHYSPGSATPLWEQMRGTAVLELMRRPFFLRLVAETAVDMGPWDGDVAALLTAYVRRALVREIERRNPQLEPNGLLDERDYERILSGRGWRDAYELPGRGRLFRQLSELAHGMQVAAIENESPRVRIGYSEALELLGGSDGAAVIRVGEELGLLDEDRGADEVMFEHRLLQDYFAGRKMAHEPQMELAS